MYTGSPNSVTLSVEHPDLKQENVAPAIIGCSKCDEISFYCGLG